MSVEPTTSGISETVRAIVEAKVIEAFRSTPEYIDELVKSAMSGEVDPDTGTANTHRYTGRVPYLTFAASRAVRSVVMKTVEGEIEKQRPAIEDAVRRALKSDDIADMFVKSFLDAVDKGSPWRLNVQVGTSPKADS